MDCECLEERRGIEEREDVEPQAYCSDWPRCQKGSDFDWLQFDAGENITQLVRLDMGPYKTGSGYVYSAFRAKIED